MNIISPLSRAERLAQLAVNSSFKAVARRIRNLKKGNEYLEGTHLFRLFLGTEPQNSFAVMTGREAKARNDIFRVKFVEAINQEIDNGVPTGQTKARSKHWTAIERNYVEPDGLCECDGLGIGD
jgi:hypothetical protein